jgi:hypothetical protein
MSHYAKVTKGIVQQVIVANAEFFDTFVDTTPGAWIQTSYNTRGNIHYGPDGKPDGGEALRGNYAGIGYTYDPVNDVFYPPQPYNSWTISAATNWTWTPPVEYPTDGKVYVWNEAATNWITFDDPTQQF